MKEMSVFVCKGRVLFRREKEAVSQTGDYLETQTLQFYTSNLGSHSS